MAVGSGTVPVHLVWHSHTVGKHVGFRMELALVLLVELLKLGERQGLAVFQIGGQGLEAVVAVRNGGHGKREEVG